MGWQRSGSGTLYYVSRRIVRGKVVTTYGGTGARGRRAGKLDKKARLKRRIDLHQLELEEAAHQLLHEMTDEIIRQHLIYQGYIQRNRKWIWTDNLRSPLTELERAMIQEVKSTYQPIKLKTRKIKIPNPNRRQPKLDTELLAALNQRVPRRRNDPETERILSCMNLKFALSLPKNWVQSNPQNAEHSDKA
jgi:hypothetical protein